MNKLSFFPLFLFRWSIPRFFESTTAVQCPHLDLHLNRSSTSPNQSWIDKAEDEYDEIWTNENCTTVVEVTDLRMNPYYISVSRSSLVDWLLKKVSMPEFHFRSTAITWTSLSTFSYHWLWWWVWMFACTVLCVTVGSVTRQEIWKITKHLPHCLPKKGELRPGCQLLIPLLHLIVITCFRVKALPTPCVEWEALMRLNSRKGTPNTPEPRWWWWWLLLSATPRAVSPTLWKSSLASKTRPRYPNELFKH